MRVTPRIWIGLAVFVGYMLLVLVVQSSTGIPYTEWGASAGNLFIGVVLSLIIATIILVPLITWLRWWRPVIHERERSRHRWPIIAPILMAGIAIVGLISADWGAVSGAFLLAALGLCLVGFTEEVVTRGVLLVGLRTRLAEVWVWLISSALFALMHLINIVLGLPVPGTLAQVAAAFGTGTVLYILRRTTGSLIPAMILHALWDFNIFVLGNGTPGPAAGFIQVLYLPVIVFALISVAFVIRGANEHITTNQPDPSDQPKQIHHRESRTA
ncbi:CPBP family intramembrane glutamic endopeptidase [uncultured Arthrobacter sp.]|uniref:CPBP family intramembrane glutamic endopeptidase n=1 Tax=uncultured Arthrobacter sp. TaxID=114050 RepID=UPI0025F6B384|nr:CPBP family intramembrane glutamic endopeptidase [uncultured Arthrobacter sp.]